MTTKQEVELTIRDNIIRIKSICEEYLKDFNPNDSNNLSFVEAKNKEIEELCLQNKATISSFESRYLSPLNELKELTTSISQNEPSQQ